MDEYFYQQHETERGTHILIFKEGNDSHIFDRKVFVPVSEYLPDAVACVVDKDFKELYTGPHAYAIEWIRQNPGEARMVGVGGDFQILSVDEYVFHYRP